MFINIYGKADRYDNQGEALGNPGVHPNSKNYKKFLSLKSQTHAKPKSRVSALLYSQIKYKTKEDWSVGRYNMNHKRCRPKSTRAGCLLCKPHKRQGSPIKDRDKPSLKRKLQEKPTKEE
jgi:hypothetical protein